MSSAHRLRESPSGLVIDTHDLGRQAGRMKEMHRTAEAPADLGIVVISVPPGSPIELDLRLESVVEGVLVTGTALMELSGECVRCLGEVSDDLEIDIQELFMFSGSEASDEEASQMDGDLLDLEPVIRDEVVLELPFRPLCREDCEGLCAECGVNLNDAPDHNHDAPIDPRWGKLASLGGSED